LLQLAVLIITMFMLIVAVWFGYGPF